MASRAAARPGRLWARRSGSGRKIGDVAEAVERQDRMAHSITIDEYRISKRAGVGQSVVLEFRADRTGTVTFYCNMMQDERCRNMKGQLVVR